MKLLLRFFLILFLLNSFSLTAVDPDSIVRKAETVTQARYPDADYVLLYDFQSATYQEDGTGTETDDFYSKILTEKGRRELRTMRLGFNPVYGSVEVPTLEIIRNGKIIPVDVAANSRIAVDAGQMGANIYDPNHKELTVAVPDLLIGDILHAVTRSTITKPRIPDVWCNIFVLQSTSPILEYVVRIDAPASRPLRAIAIKNEVPKTVTFREARTDDRILYTWKATNVPQIFPEPNMPPLYTCVQRLLVSTVPDWKEISKWYYNLSRPRLDAVTPEMKETVKRLTKDAKTPEEKVMKLFQFVSQNIRYMGITPEKEAPGYEPHDVSMTFNNRYGVCRDKAALLVSMLELAGLHAYPVLFSAGSKKDVEVPNNYFNHAVVAVQLKDGAYILMDPTFETTTELLPSALADMSYLVARKEGETLLTSPVVPAEQNMLRIKGVGTISRDGVLHYRATLDFQGVNDQVYRDAFSRWPQERRRQYFAAQLKQAVPGAELETLNVLPSNIRDMSRELQVELSFKAPYALSSSGVFPLQTVSLAGVIGMTDSVLGSTGLESRKYPMDIYSTCGVSEESRLKFPEGVVPAVPPRESLEITSPALNFRGSDRFENGELISKGKLTIDRMQILPSEYLELKRALREIELAAREYPLFRADGKIEDPAKAFPTADAVLLLSDQAKHFKKDGEWEAISKVRIKVLNYAGVKRFSELKVDYNPASGSAELQNAAVIDPDGKRHELTAKELNRMDASWVGGAPRYPAGKILVANFPGVKPGSIIEYTLIRKDKKPWGSEFTGLFGGVVPILQKRVSVTADAGVKLTRSDRPAHVTKEGATLIGSNIPAIANEPGAPPLHQFIPALRASDSDYEAYGQLLLSEVARLAANQSAAAAKARELVAKAQDDAAKILAIRNFVARSIRYAGPAFTDLPLTALSPADKTLADGYGNNADHAILLKSMLDAVGIPSKLLAASSLPDTPDYRTQVQEIPEPEVFDKLLLAVRSGSETWYLNDGGEYASPGACSFDGKLTFDPAENRIFRLRATQITIEESFHMDIVLRENGSALLKITERFSGTDFESQKRRYSEFTPEELRRHIQHLVSSISQSARLLGDVQTDFETYPATLRYQLEIPDFAVRNGKFRQLELPRFNRISWPIRTMETQRQTPYERTESLEYRYSWRVALPSGWTVKSTPAGFMESTRLETVLVDCRTRPHSVECRAELEARPGTLTPTEYANLAKLQSKLNALPLRVVILNVSNETRKGR